MNRPVSVPASASACVPRIREDEPDKLEHAPPNNAIALNLYLFGTSVNARSGMRDIRIHALISATR